MADDFSDLIDKPDEAAIAEDANTAVPATGPDMYGQYHPIETKDIIASKLVEFQQELDKLEPNKEAAKHHLWSDDSFRLLFLRCEVFHADRAAQRFLKYWEKRLELFGNAESLHVSKIDRGCLEMGYFRVMVPNDGSRPFVFVDPSQLDRSRYTIPEMTKAVWYMLHTLFLETTLVPTKGLIMVGYLYNVTLSHVDRDLVKSVLGSIQGCLPVRMSAFHICNPPTIFRVIFPIISVFMQPRLRRRVLVHSSDVAEQLTGEYSFKKEHLPTDIGGDLVLDAAKWTKERERKDRISTEVAA